MAPDPEPQPSSETTDGPTPPRGWRGRVRFTKRAGGFAYHPTRVVCADDAALATAQAVTGSDDRTTIAADNVWGLLHDFGEHAPQLDALAVVEEVRRRGHRCDPDYVLFANPMWANPMWANPMWANPMWANPMWANPMWANPVWANSSGSFSSPTYANPVYTSPVYPNPVFANPKYAEAYICDGERPSTARPAPAPDIPVEPYAGQSASDQVIILDTGISALTYDPDGTGSGTYDPCPPVLRDLALGLEAEWEVPDGDDATNFLDPVSGHGTFIAGLIQSLAPNRKLVPARVVESYGDVTTSAVIARLDAQLATMDAQTIVNMSFGGYADEDMPALAAAIARVRRTEAVVVASAGNDATDRPLFPACLPDVVAVGALDQYGPAAYSNHGAWVDACAPGTDLVAPFYKYDGDMELPPMPGGVDPDDYENWARWTGTSFAAPVVTAALLRHMEFDRATGGTGTAAEAVTAVVDTPTLFRLPGLGTVVNLAPPERDCF